MKHRKLWNIFDCITIIGLMTAVFLAIMNSKEYITSALAIFPYLLFAAAICVERFTKLIITDENEKFLLAANISCTLFYLVCLAVQLLSKFVITSSKGIQLFFGYSVPLIVAIITRIIAIQRRDDTRNRV
jgi:hypothetical protein